MMRKLSEHCVVACLGVLLMAIGGASSSADRPVDSATATAALKAAAAQMRDGDYSGAAATLAKVLDPAMNDADYAQVGIVLAFANMHAGQDPDGMIDVLREILKRMPAYEYSLMIYGDEFMEKTSLDRQEWHMLPRRIEPGTEPEGPGMPRWMCVTKEEEKAPLPSQIWSAGLRAQGLIADTYYGIKRDFAAAIAESEKELALRPDSEVAAARIALSRMELAKMGALDDQPP